MAPPHGVAHVALSVTDLGRATRFYSGTLGLREVPRPTLGGAGTWLAAGNAMIHLALVERIPEPRDPVGHFALHVDTEDIRTLVDAVRGGGGSVLRDVTVRNEFGSLVTSAICSDADGNRFELTDAAALPG